MNKEEKIDRLRTIMEDGDPDEVIEPVTLEYYLDQAEEAILNKMYYFSAQASQRVMPSKYDNLQIRIATYLLNKRGAEGEVQHIENGIHRNYGSADIPEVMLKDVTPFVNVIS